MSLATGAYQQLSHYPHFGRLLHFARSDNPLVALAVARREVSWTQFLEWLLDPFLDPSRSQCFVEAMLATAKGSYLREQPCQTVAAQALSQFIKKDDLALNEVQSVKAEVREGKSGRSDLTVQCVVNGCRLTILIENKIDSTESKEQLVKYVAHQLSEGPAIGVLLPILIQLGDDAPDICTCEWALCWRRMNVRDWFERGRNLCTERRLTVPNLVDHYLALFAAWDDAAFLRQECWQLLDVMQRNPAGLVDWPRVASYLMVSDQQFFDESLRVPQLRQVLEEYRFDEAVSYPTILGRNAGMRISKSSWKIGRPGPHDERMYVHFESRNRRSIEVHVEVWPYEGSLHKKPVRQAELAHLLRVKEALIPALRSDLVELDALGATDRGLRPPRAINTGTAIKFAGELGNNCTPEQLAAFVTRVIHVAGPRIESVMAKIASSA